MKPYTVDNFLSEEDFKSITDVVVGSDIDRHYSYSVADGSQEEDDMYFIHMLYMGLDYNRNFSFLHLFRLELSS